MQERSRRKNNEKKKEKEDRRRRRRRSRERWQGDDKLSYIIQYVCVLLSERSEREREQTLGNASIE